MSDLGFSPAILDRSELLKSLRAFRKGDFSVRMPMDLVGIDGEIAGAFNDVVEMNEMLAEEFARIRDEVGKEGQINQRARLASATGSWADCVESVNALIGDLVHPTEEVARVIESVAKGDLAQTMWLEMDGRPLRGEFLRIGKVVNTMVNQLGGFALENEAVSEELRRRMLGWRHGGFSAHNVVCVGAEDAEGRKKLAGYMLRAPMSLQKMSYDAASGTVIYRSKMHAGLKRNFQVMPGAQWLALLCKHIPDRYEHNGFIIHTFLCH